jgi:hypothetical protein
MDGMTITALEQQPVILITSDSDIQFAASPSPLGRAGEIFLPNRKPVSATGSGRCRKVAWVWEII